MDFVRKKKHGQNQKVRRSWFTETGYRIVWRKEFWGVQVPARYQACVRILIPYNDGTLHEVWDFVNRERRLIKTYKVAQDECEKHQRLWTQATGAAGIRVLKGLFGERIPMGFPLWVRSKLNRCVYAILSDNSPRRSRDDYEEEECETAPNDPTRTSDSSALPTEATTDAPIPASSAKEKGHKRSKSTSKRSRKAIGSTGPSAAPPAKAQGKGRKRRVAKRTKKSSKRTAAPATSTTDSSPTAAKRSRSSRKSKSESSKNSA